MNEIKHIQNTNQHLLNTTCNTSAPQHYWVQKKPTLFGFAISMTCVIAAGGRKGLCAGRSEPDGSCNRSLHVCNNETTLFTCETITMDSIHEGIQWITCLNFPNLRFAST